MINFVFIPSKETVLEPGVRTAPGTLTLSLAQVTNYTDQSF